MQALTASSHAIYRAQRDEISAGFDKWAESDESDHVAFANRIFDKFSACFSCLPLNEWSFSMLGVYCVVKYQFPLDQAVEIMECKHYLGSLYLAQRLNTPGVIGLSESKYRLVCAAYDLVSKDLDLLLRQPPSTVPASTSLDSVPSKAAKQKKKKRDSESPAHAAPASSIEDQEEPAPKKQKGGRKSKRTPEEKKQATKEAGKRYRERKKAAKEAEKNSKKDDENDQLKKALDEEIASAESKSNSPDAVSKEEDQSDSITPAPAAPVVSGATDQDMSESAVTATAAAAPMTVTKTTATEINQAKTAIESATALPAVEKEEIKPPATPSVTNAKASAPSTPVSKPAPAVAATISQSNNKKKDPNQVDIDLEPSEEDLDGFPSDEENGPSPSPAKKNSAVGMDQLLLGSGGKAPAPASSTPQRPTAELTLPDRNRIMQLYRIEFDKKKKEYIAAVVRANNTKDEHVPLASVPESMVLDFLSDFRAKLDGVRSIPTDPSNRYLPIIHAICLKGDQIAIYESHMVAGYSRLSRDVPPQSFPVNSRPQIVAFCDNVRREIQ